MSYCYLDECDQRDQNNLQQTLKTLSTDTAFRGTSTITTDMPNTQQGFSGYDDRLDLHQYVGWDLIVDASPLLQKLFSKTTVRVIQQKVADYLLGVHPEGKRIVPAERVVATALYGTFKNYAPRTGDMYGKYTVVDASLRNDYAAIVDQTISLLVQGIRDDLGMIEQNEKLTIWTTVLGDFNEHGLRQHPPIKLNNGKRPDPMLFHMRY
jgi:hypothetical protein